MSMELAKEHLKKYNLADRIKEFEVSSATVELAAIAVGVEGARIAKSLSLKIGDGAIIIVVAGDAKIDNSKFKAEFHTKAKMLQYDEVLPMIGHQVGGVCPFGINDGVDVYLDKSLQRFEIVYPASGTSNSAVELNLDELYTASNAIKWIDVCKY